jgi:hypothetical protein
MRIVKLGGAVGLVMLLGACGSGGGGTDDPATSSPTGSASARSSASASPPAAPAADKGPECEGRKDAGGLHLLRGGTTEVPGAGKVVYAQARADGTHRTAVLTAGADRRTATAGQKITLSGHPFTVAQICTYRVVLTTTEHSGTDHGTDQGTDQGADMAKWPTTQDGHWRLRWHVPDNGPETGAVVTDIQSGPARASISVTAPGKGQLAFYDDVRKGGTVEIAGRLWKVETVDAGTNSSGGQGGHVDLRELGDA